MMLDRDEYQDVFLSYMEKMKFLDDHGWSESFYGGFENNTFYIKSYHWGDCTCGGDNSEFTSPELHNTECLIYKPNFIYKPNDFNISWYKYPLRGNEINKDITMDEFTHMLEDCLKSI